MADETWTVTNRRCEPAALAEFNSVFTISNGYLGLTGNLQEDRDGPCPVTLINGVYDELDMFGLLRPSAAERPWLDPTAFDGAGKSPAVAILADPLFVRVFVGDREVSLRRGRVLDFHQELDLRCGLYHYTYSYDAGRYTIRIAVWRFASLAHAHRAYMRYQLIAPSNVPVRLLSGINGRVHSNLTRERVIQIVDMDSGPDGTCRCHVRTNARQHDVWLTVTNRVVEGRVANIRGVCAHDQVYTVYERLVGASQPLTIDRFVCLSSCEDARHGERLPPARADESQHAAREGFDTALQTQRTRWQALWERADARIDGDATAQQYLRFCLYHVLAAAPRFTDRLSVPVKLLTGDSYQGNTFYDTDLYIIPFYTCTVPEYARTCLNYRYEGLPAARRIAQQLGYAGAKFAWQAGPYGEECLGPWYRFPRTNIHINAAVAYSLMQYYWATGDGRFLAERGVDILVEAARFYASRAAHDGARNAYDLRAVAGPDEAHCDSSNNFYTNYLAQRTLRWAADEAERVRGSERVARLRLDEGEPAHWRQVADRLTLLFDPHTKLYEQCAGFFQLAPAPANLLTNRTDWFVPLARYQALNQPDVLMALALFRDEFPFEVRRANWEYYQGKSMDLSSMSFAINSIMAADVGELERAYREFIISAGMDLDETLTGRHDTHAGLHGTAMGGAWLAAVFGFGGVHLTQHGLRIDPHLPPNWQRLEFNLALRSALVRVSINHNEVAVRSLDGRPVDLPVTVAGQSIRLDGAQPVHVRHGR